MDKYIFEYFILGIYLISILWFGFYNPTMFLGVFLIIYPSVKKIRKDIKEMAEAKKGEEVKQD